MFPNISKEEDIDIVFHGTVNNKDFDKIRY